MLDSGNVCLVELHVPDVPYRLLLRRLACGVHEVRHTVYSLDDVGVGVGEQIGDVDVLRLRFHIRGGSVSVRLLREIDRDVRRHVLVIGVDFAVSAFLFRSVDDVPGVVRQSAGSRHDSSGESAAREGDERVYVCVPCESFLTGGRFVITGVHELFLVLLIF